MGMPFLYFNSVTKRFHTEAMSSQTYIDYPLFAHSRPFRTDLQPGELLFVPSNSPHMVENLEDTIAISGNYIDGYNVAAAVDELVVEHAATGDIIRHFQQCLAQPDGCQVDLKKGDTPWDELKAGRGFWFHPPRVHMVDAFQNMTTQAQGLGKRVLLQFGENSPSG